ncbi:MAG: 4Fe-4S dicluster domain-containing protein [Chloroflexi bacterium]|nr:4Fe-4S dicluster domain-containing protein [Chloroflexota bacterium]
MVVDVDRCTGCQACVVACQVENNAPLSSEESFQRRRPMQWIRIERYWEGEYPHIKARFLPLLCQQCGNAPCEPVCPVYATYHNREGLNVQIYPRCIGTRFCANNCPYNARFFNWVEHQWPPVMANYLNPHVTVRPRGIMEKCTFCIHRLHRAQRQAKGEGRVLRDGEVQPACVQTCPTNALVFGNLKDPNSRVSSMVQDERHYRLLEELGTEPSVVYLKKVVPGGRAS